MMYSIFSPLFRLHFCLDGKFLLLNIVSPATKYSFNYVSQYDFCKIDTSFIKVSATTNLS